jgi:hypothetical protein
MHIGDEGKSTSAHAQHPFNGAGENKNNGYS